MSDGALALTRARTSLPPVTATVATRAEWATQWPVPTFFVRATGTTQPAPVEQGLARRLAGEEGVAARASTHSCHRGDGDSKTGAQGRRLCNL